jgi:hypothetical protein
MNLHPAQINGCFSELVKIGEDAEKKLKEPAKKSWWKGVGRDVLLGGVGVGTGYGISRALEYAVPALRQPAPSRAKAMKYILPILGGAGFILADRYRRLMDESHKQAPGWPDPRR